MNGQLSGDSHSAGSDRALFLSTREVVVRAALAVEEVYHSGEYTVTQKGSEGPLTDADLLSNDICHRGLLPLLPDSGWLSEESADSPERHSRRHVWIVDPIDGTREFVNRKIEFSVSAGLSEAGAAVLGAVALPVDGRIMVGSRGEGFHLYRYSSSPRGAIHYEELPHEFSRRRDLTGARILVSSSEWRKGKFASLESEFEIIHTGSIARKLALLAAGEADLVVSLYPKNDWDICGGTALIQSIPGTKVVTLEESRERVFNETETKSYGLAAGPASLVDLFVDYFHSKKIVLERSYH